MIGAEAGSVVAVGLFGVTLTGTLALALAAIAGTAILGVWFLAEALRQRPQPIQDAVGLAATRLTRLVQRVLPFWFAAIAASILLSTRETKNDATEKIASSDSPAATRCSRPFCHASITCS